MLPFGVTIPATVPQGSEIPEGLMNNSVFGTTAPPPVGQVLLIHEVSRSHTTNAPQSVGLLWTSDQPVAETSDKTQHSQQTDIHAPRRIRIHNLSRRAAADLIIRLRGHWDRRYDPLL